MYFTSNNGYQNFLVFASMLSSLIVNDNKKVAKWISNRISSYESKPFDINFEPTMSNLTNGRIILKFSSSVIVQKNCIVSLYSSFSLSLHIVYELNN